MCDHDSLYVLYTNFLYVWSCFVEQFKLSDRPKSEKWAFLYYDDLSKGGSTLAETIRNVVWQLYYQRSCDNALATLQEEAVSRIVNRVIRAEQKQRAMRDLYGSVTAAGGKSYQSSHIHSVETCCGMSEFEVIIMIVCTYRVS